MFLDPLSSVPHPQDSDLLVITILDENDNRPVFTRTSYRAEITENSAAGSTQPGVCLSPLSFPQSVAAAWLIVPKPLSETLSPPHPDFVYIRHSDVFLL